jgi:hypothetical protein
VDMPLWRLPITGVSVGAPVQLFTVLPSLKALGDSVSQIRTVLYNNPNNSMSGSVTLSKAATNFDELEVYCKTDDGIYVFTKVASPASGTSFDVSCAHYNDSKGIMYVKAKEFTLTSPTVINTASGQSNKYWYTGIWGSDGTRSQGDYITIVKVVGLKWS